MGATRAMGVMVVTAGGATVAMVAMVAMDVMDVMDVMGVTQAAGGAMEADARARHVVRCRRRDVMASDVKATVEKGVTVLWQTISRWALPEYRGRTLAGNRDVR